MTMGNLYSLLWVTETPVLDYHRTYYGCKKHRRVYRSKFSHKEVRVGLFGGTAKIGLTSLPCQKDEDSCDIFVNGKSRHYSETGGSLHEIMWFERRMPPHKHLDNLEEIDEDGCLTHPGRNIKRSIRK